MKPLLQLLLDNVENDIRVCKATVKRAVVDAEFDPRKVSDNPNQASAV
jgi:hypothetical protein